MAYCLIIVMNHVDDDDFADFSGDIDDDYV